MQWNAVVPLSTGIYLHKGNNAWVTSQLTPCICISSNLRATFQRSRQLACPNYCQGDPDAFVSSSSTEEDYQQASQP